MDNELIEKLEKWKIPGTNEMFDLEHVFKHIKEFSSVSDYEYDIAVGTDSQMIGKVFKFISVISAHRIGKGGIFYYHKSLVSRHNFPVENQKLRMFNEVARSIELATDMYEAIKIKPVIHIDASPSSKKLEFTAKFSDQLKGYVQGCDFNCLLKPESYAAFSISNRFTKQKTRKRKRKFQRNL